MAMAALRFLPYLARIFRIKSFNKILRAVNLFVNANSKLKAKKVLDFEDLTKLSHNLKDKKHFVNFLKDMLFNNLQTHKFIFFSEEELRNYILSIDKQAKILKILETQEIDLYIVEFSDIQLFIKTDDFDVVQMITGLFNLNMAYLFFKTFYFQTLAEIQKAEDDILNYLVYLTNSEQNNNDLFDFLENMRNNLKNEVDNIINQRKNEDIANTYCVSCSCCCSCTKGSCCCSCDCDLVHYTQAWEDARADLKNAVDNAINQIKQRIQHDYLDDNNENSLYHYINMRLFSNQANSLRMLFISLASAFLFNMRHKHKQRLLFAVIKAKNILKISKLIEREKNKKNILKTVYLYLRENHYNKLVEYDKLIRELQRFLKKKYERDFTRKDIQDYLSKVKRKYIHIEKLRINNKYFLKIGKGDKND